jgi:HPt (histidine-containing phosphotransfer) domain-containing protein
MRGTLITPSQPTDARTTAWTPSPLVLEAASGEDGLIAEIVDVFNTSTADRIRQIHAALAASDFSTIRKEAHAIKGGAQQIGAPAVADACQELERVCQLGEASLVPARLARVCELFEEIRIGMISYCNRRRVNL